MVYRIYVEKKPGFDGEAQGLKHELVELVGIKGLKALRLLNRYDVEGIDRDLFEKAIPTVFSEPPVDVTYTELPTAKTVFAVEYLPGQFDQRADSASECIQLLSQGERPSVRSARIYLLDGELSAEDLEAIGAFAKQAAERITAGTAETIVQVPGNSPVGPYYTPLGRDGQPAKFLKAKPLTDMEKCSKCGETDTIPPKSFRLSK